MERNFLHRLLLLSGLITVAVTALFFYCYFKPQREIPECATVEVKPVNFCGTEKITSEEKKGKILFNAYCSVCHKMDAKSSPDFIKDVFKKLPNEQYFGQFITNQDSLLKAKHPRATQLKKEFPNGFQHNFELSKEDIANLKLYIK